MFGPKVTHGAVSGVDPDTHAKGLMQAIVDPSVSQLFESLLHGDGHGDAADRVLLGALALGVAEKYHYCVTNILISGSAILEGYSRHLIQIVIQGIGQVLGFKTLCDGGKAHQIRKKYRQLLARAGQTDGLVTAKNRLVNLRREIFGQLIRQPLQLGIFFLSLSGELAQAVRAAVIEFYQALSGFKQMFILV